MEVFEADHALEPSVLLLAQVVTVGGCVRLDISSVSLHRKGGDVILNDVLCCYLVVDHVSCFLGKLRKENELFD